MKCSSPTATPWWSRNIRLPFVGLSRFFFLLSFLTKTYYRDRKCRFTTADKVAGGRGFRAVWTEVKPPGECDEYNHFRCVNNSFCIAKHLECDGNLNCGLNDDSDESHCNISIMFFLLFDIVLMLSLYSYSALPMLRLLVPSNCFPSAESSNRIVIVWLK